MSQENKIENVTVNEQANEEEKRKLLENLREFFKKLGKFFSQLGKASIVQQMKDMQEELEMSLTQNSITSDTVEDLYELVNDLDGKLDTITPKNAEKILEEFQTDSKEILNKEPTVDVEKIRINLETALEDYGVEASAFDNIKAISDESDKNHYYLIVNDEIYEAVANVLKDEEKPKIDITIKPCQHSDLLGKDGELKEGYSFIPKIDGNAEHELLIAICKANGLRYTFDMEKEKQRQLSKLSPRGLFLKSRMDKIYSSENGRYESKYFASAASFHVRDTETGDMIRFESTPSEIKMYLYRDTKSLNVLGSTKEYKLGSWKDNGNGTVKAKISSDDANVSALLHCSEVEKWLGFNGITRELLDRAYQHETDTQWNKVESVEGLKRVDALRNACEEAIEGEDYTVQLSNSKKSNFTFLNISLSPKEEQDIKNLPRLSFAFDKEGNPQVINYKGEHGKAKFIYNLKTKNLSPNYKEFRDNNDFKALYNIAYEAVKSVGIESGMKHIGKKNKIRNVEESQQNKAEKELIFVPEENRNLNMGYEYDSLLKAYDKQYADKVNKVALFAIKNRKISENQIRELLNCDKDEATKMANTLTAMGIIEDDKRTYNTIMTEMEYSKLVSSFASDYSQRTRFIDTDRGEDVKDSFAAFLIDSYKDTLDNRFEKQKETYHEEIVKGLAAVGDVLHEGKRVTIENAQLQHAIGEFNQAYRTNKLLEKMGIVSEDKTAKPREILCNETELKQIFKDFDKQAYMNFEKRLENYDTRKANNEKKEKPSKKQEGIEQD